MDYIYILEKLANKNLLSDELYIEDRINVIYLLCYHITTSSKYPFLQFMLEKIPYDNKVVNEQFTLPFILCNDKTTNIQETVIKKVKHALSRICKDTSVIEDEMYKGIVVENTAECKTFAVVNVTGIDICGLHLLRNSLSWFVLPSEILNTKYICNIEIDTDVTELFTRIPRLALLTNPNTNNTYIIPDAVYRGAEYNKVEFNSVFCNSKTKEYDSCGEYFYFNNSFENSVRYGGWTKEGGIQLIDTNNILHTHSVSNRLITDNEYGRHIHGGINRYALFIEGDHYTETEKEFSLTDKMIETLYNDPTILISHTHPHTHPHTPDILVKEYSSFASLSFHTLKKSLLDEQYIPSNKDKYMIM